VVYSRSHAWRHEPAKQTEAVRAALWLSRVYALPRGYILGVSPPSLALLCRWLAPHKVFFYLSRAHHRPISKRRSVQWHSQQHIHKKLLGTFQLLSSLFICVLITNQQWKLKEYWDRGALWSDGNLIFHKPRRNFKVLQCHRSNAIKFRRAF
jgi:hypothetical protein